MLQSASCTWALPESITLKHKIHADTVVLLTPTATVSQPSQLSWHVKSDDFVFLASAYKDSVYWRINEDFFSYFLFTKIKSKHSEAAISKRWRWRRQQRKKVQTLALSRASADVAEISISPQHSLEQAYHSRWQACVSRKCAASSGVWCLLTCVDLKVPASRVYLDPSPASL